MDPPRDALCDISRRCGRNGLGEWLCRMGREAKSGSMRIARAQAICNLAFGTARVRHHSVCAQVAGLLPVDSRQEVAILAGRLFKQGAIGEGDVANHAASAMLTPGRVVAAVSATE